MAILRHGAVVFNGFTENHTTAELASLVGLTRREPRLKVVVEMGGARALRWQPLEQLVAA